MESKVPLDLEAAVLDFNASCKSLRWVSGKVSMTVLNELAQGPPANFNKDFMASSAIDLYEFDLVESETVKGTSEVLDWDVISTSKGIKAFMADSVVVSTIQAESSIALPILSSNGIADGGKHSR